MLFALSSLAFARCRILHVTDVAAAVSTFQAQLQQYQLVWGEASPAEATGFGAEKCESAERSTEDARTDASVEECT
jgi:hypothetical protein